ncbi:MAG: cytochrome c oxidase subunit 3 family protein [Blastocatellia bacterium]
MEQQAEAGKLGMWLFLVTEVLLFGGLFAGYALMFNAHPSAFHEGHHHLDWKLGALNTAILIFSSLTMALAVRAAQTSNQSALIKHLVVTFLCACGFLVVKYFEYSHKIHEGLLPGKFYAYAQPDGSASDPYIGTYFSFYFMMTGVHGIHVLAGMSAIAWVLWRSLKGHFNAEYNAPVEITGLYWHLVDLIWIYLFPLLYLVR